MIDALAYMKHAVRWRFDAAEGQLKDLERGFVRLCLLGGDDFVECDVKLRSGGREQIIVDVGEYG